MDRLLQRQMSTATLYSFGILEEGASTASQNSMETAEEIPSKGWFRQSFTDCIIPQKNYKFNSFPSFFLMQVAL